MILADGNRAAFLPLILDRLTQADGLGWDCSRLWRFKSRSRFPEGLTDRKAKAEADPSLSNPTDEDLSAGTTVRSG